jgi:hypothetical protein
MHSISHTKRTRLMIGTIALVFSFMLTLIPGSNAAAENEATVNVKRLVGTYVGITIDFPTEINGSFGGTMNGKHFDCQTIPPNELYCFGPLAYWVDSATLFIYAQGSGEVIFSKIISVPPNNGDSGIPSVPQERESELQ